MDALCVRLQVRTTTAKNVVLVGIGKLKPSHTRDIDLKEKVMCLKTTLRKINVVHGVCNHIVGKNHAFVHRAVGGVVVMIGGVLIAKTLGHHPEFYLATIGDVLGYGLHGVGLIPFVEEVLLVAASE